MTQVGAIGRKLEILHPDLLTSFRLRAAVRSYRKDDAVAAMSHLHGFLDAIPQTRGLRVDAILPKGGSTIRIMARLRRGDGKLLFLKVSKPTDEIRFFEHAEQVAEELGDADIRIDVPLVAIKTMDLHCLLMPYHDFMLTAARRFEPCQITAALAHFNSHTRHLRGLRDDNIQQRRYGNVPNLTRTTMLRAGFLKTQADVFGRTFRALRDYRVLQAEVPEVLCHGDVTPGNFYCRDGTTHMIDFGNYIFAQPGYDAGRLYGGVEERLDQICGIYARAFGAGLSYSHLRLAVVHGHFITLLKRAAKGEKREAFRAALARLETEINQVGQEALVR